MKVFVVDLQKCNGCYACQVACKDEHCGNDWSPYSKPEPLTGQFWCHLTERTHGQVPKVRVEYRPVFGAQNEAIREYAPEVLMPREDGLIVIDPEKAVGRKDLADKFDGIYWNEELQIPQGCTGCAHLVDDGKLPHCVDACPTDALRFGDAEDFADELEDAVDDFGPVDDSIVKYLHPFRLFISGEVWDPAKDLIIEGAKVSLASGDGTVLETETDGFGDFWFHHIERGIYTLRIEADGFKEVEKRVDLNDSLNIGDFPLEKAE